MKIITKNLRTRPFNELRLKIQEILNDQQFFRREEAAEFLRVSLSTIDRMLKCGDLKKTYLRPRVPLITRAQLVKRVRLGG